MRMLRTAVLWSALILASGCSMNKPSAGAGNSPPVADAGTDRTVGLGIVALDGSNSNDPDGDSLSYQWALDEFPPGSASVLSDPGAAAPTFEADLAEDYVARLIVNDGTEDSAPDSVTIHVEFGGITLFSRTIGAGLQYTENANLGFTNHGGVTVRVASSDGNIVRIAPNQLTPGGLPSPVQSFIDLFVPAGSGTFSYTVQGVAGSAGSVTVSASATGFAEGTGTITVVQPAVMILGLAASGAVGNNDPFDVRVGIPNGSGTGLSGLQEISAGNTSFPVLTLESEDGAVGQLSIGGGSPGATVAQQLAAGIFQIQAAFVPLSAGQTTITASIPGFLSTTAAVQPITVDLPGITTFSRTIGAGLQYSGNADLDTPNHGGITVHIASSDKNVARIAMNGSTPGDESSPVESSIDLFVPDGTATFGYAVQGVAGAAGSVTVTVSAPGFTDGTGEITVVQPAVVISGLEASRSAGSLPDSFTVLLGTPNGSGTGLSGIQGISAGNTPFPFLALESEDGAVGQVSIGSGTAGNVVSQQLAAGVFQLGAAFTALTAGQTTVTASIPGFLSTTSAIQLVTVTGP